MLRKKHEIKTPKDLLPEPADLENDEMATEVDDVDIVPEDVIELEAEEPLSVLRQDHAVALPPNLRAVPSPRQAEGGKVSRIHGASEHRAQEPERTER